MFNHVTDFVAIRLVPAKVVVARVDYQNIPVAHFHPLFNHLGGVDVVIATHVAEVYHGRFPTQKVKRQRGNVLAGRVKVNFAI